MRVVEQVDEPGRQLGARLVPEDAVGPVVDDRGCGDDVAAVTAGVDQLAEPAGGVPEMEPASGCGSSDGYRRTGSTRCRCRGRACRRPARRAHPHRIDRSRLAGWSGLVHVGVDDQQPGGTAGDADAVRAVRPGAADPVRVLRGALFPAGVAVAAPRVGLVAPIRGDVLGRPVAWCRARGGRRTSRASRSRAPAVSRAAVVSFIGSPRQGCCRSPGRRSRLGQRTWRDRPVDVVGSFIETVAGVRDRGLRVPPVVHLVAGEGRVERALEVVPQDPVQGEREVLELGQGLVDVGGRDRVREQGEPDDRADGLVGVVGVVGDLAAEPAAVGGVGVGHDGSAFRGCAGPRPRLGSRVEGRRRGGLVSVADAGRLGACYRATALVGLVVGRVAEPLLVARVRLAGSAGRLRRRDVGGPLVLTLGAVVEGGV